MTPRRWKTGSPSARVLETLSVAGGEPMYALDIADEAETSVTTVWRLVAVLQREGAVVKTREAQVNFYALVEGYDCERRGSYTCVTAP